MGHAEQCRSGDSTPVNGSVVDEDEIGFGDGGGTLASGWEAQPMGQPLTGEPFPLAKGLGGAVTMEDAEEMLEWGEQQSKRTGPCRSNSESVINDVSSSYFLGGAGAGERGMGEGGMFVPLAQAAEQRALATAV